MVCSECFNGSTNKNCVLAWQYMTSTGQTHGAMTLVPVPLVI